MGRCPPTPKVGFTGWDAHEPADSWILLAGGWELPEPSVSGWVSGTGCPPPGTGSQPKGSAASVLINQAVKPPRFLSRAIKEQ